MCLRPVDGDCVPGYYDDYFKSEPSPLMRTNLVFPTYCLAMGGWTVIHAALMPIHIRFHS